MTTESERPSQSGERSQDRPENQRENQTEKESALAELAEGREAGIVREYLDFLIHTRKWWLLPIVVLLALAAGLVVLAGTGAAPFIYALF